MGSAKEYDKLACSEVQICSFSFSFRAKRDRERKERMKNKAAAGDKGKGRKKRRFLIVYFMNSLITAHRVY